MTALGAALIAAKRAEVDAGEVEGAIAQLRELLGLPAIDRGSPLLDWAARMASERDLPPLDEGETDSPPAEHGRRISKMLRTVDTGSFARRGDGERPAAYQRSDDREAKRRAKLVELAVWTLHSDEGCTVRTEAGTLLPTHDPYKQHQAMAVRIVDALHPKGAL